MNRVLISFVMMILLALAMRASTVSAQLGDFEAVMPQCFGRVGAIKEVIYSSSGASRSRCGLERACTSEAALHEGQWPTDWMGSGVLDGASVVEDLGVDRLGTQLALGTTPPLYTISGNVLDIGYAPIPDTMIWFEVTRDGSAGGITATFTNAYDGGYSMRLPPGTVSVTPQKDGYIFVPSSRTLVVPPGRIGQDFLGETTGDISTLVSGHVWDHEGNPISGAAIFADPGGGMVLTNESGYYEIGPLFKGCYVVSAAVDSHSLSPAARVVTVPPSAIYQSFSVVPQYATLNGHVLEAGTQQPVPNAMVSIGGDVGCSNAQGEYVLEKVLPGTHKLHVSADGYEAFTELKYTLEDYQKAALDILLQSVRSQDYYLPFPINASYRCTQGNDGPFSHSGTWRYAFDFKMATGDAVVASLEGRVVEFEEDYTEEDGCDSGKCQSYVNYIRVRHADGYDTLYYHLNHNSVTEYVKLDEFVQRGQQIAEADNTGWTTGPHLDITRHRWGGKCSQSLSFEDVDGGIPQAGKSYLSGNSLDETHVALTEVDSVPPQGTAQLLLNGTATPTLHLRAFGYLSDVEEMKLAAGGGDLSESEWVSYTSELPWPHPVAWAQFRDGGGLVSDVVSDTVDAAGYEAIVARFAVSPTVCNNAPLPIVNETMPYCEGCSWLWDFGNEVTSTAIEPQFDFSAKTSFYGYWSPGTYTVTLAVTNAFTTTSFSQTVQALPLPSAAFEIEQSGNTITVEASAREAESWTWRFGDGTTEAGQTTTHTYSGVAPSQEYLVELAVENDHGCSNSSYMTVRVGSAVYLPFVVREW